MDVMIPTPVFKTSAVWEGFLRADQEQEQIEHRRNVQPHQLALTPQPRSFKSRKSEKRGAPAFRTTQTEPRRRRNREPMTSAPTESDGIYDKPLAFQRWRRYGSDMDEMPLDAHRSTSAVPIASPGGKLVPKRRAASTGKQHIRHHNRSGPPPNIAYLFSAYHRSTPGSANGYKRGIRQDNASELSAVSSTAAYADWNSLANDNATAAAERRLAVTLGLRAREQYERDIEHSPSTANGGIARHPSSTAHNEQQVRRAARYCDLDAGETAHMPPMAWDGAIASDRSSTADSGSISVSSSDSRKHATRDKGPSSAVPVCAPSSQVRPTDTDGSPNTQVLHLLARAQQLLGSRGDSDVTPNNRSIDIAQSPASEPPIRPRKLQYTPPLSHVAPQAESAPKQSPVLSATNAVSKAAEEPKALNDTTEPRGNSIRRRLPDASPPSPRHTLRLPDKRVMVHPPRNYRSPTAQTPHVEERQEASPVTPRTPDVERKYAEDAPDSSASGQRNVTTPRDTATSVGTAPSIPAPVVEVQIDPMELKFYGIVLDVEQGAGGTAKPAQVLTVRNMSSTNMYAFRIRTRAHEHLRVSPPKGFVGAGGEERIHVQVSGKLSTLAPLSLSVEIGRITEEHLIEWSAEEFWAQLTARRVLQQYKLPCILSSSLSPTDKASAARVPPTPRSALRRRSVSLSPRPVSPDASPGRSKSKRRVSVMTPEEFSKAIHGRLDPGWQTIGAVPAPIEDPSSKETTTPATKSSKRASRRKTVGPGTFVVQKQKEGKSARHLKRSKSIDGGSRSSRKKDTMSTASAKEVNVDASAKAAAAPPNGTDPVAPPADHPVQLAPTLVFNGVVIGHEVKILEHLKVVNTSHAVSYAFRVRAPASESRLSVSPTKAFLGAGGEEIMMVQLSGVFDRLDRSLALSVELSPLTEEQLLELTPEEFWTQKPDDRVVTRRLVSCVLSGTAHSETPQFERPKTVPEKSNGVRLSKALHLAASTPSLPREAKFKTESASKARRRASMSPLAQLPQHTPTFRQPLFHKEHYESARDHRIEFLLRDGVELLWFPRATKEPFLFWKRPPHVAGRSKPRFFRCVKEEGIWCLQWGNKDDAKANKPLAHKLMLPDIRVVLGKESDAGFYLGKSSPSCPRYLCFSLIHERQPEESLDLMAPDTAVLRDIVYGLQHMRVASLQHLTLLSPTRKGKLKEVSQQATPFGALLWCTFALHFTHYQKEGVRAGYIEQQKERSERRRSSVVRPP